MASAKLFALLLGPALMSLLVSRRWMKVCLIAAAAGLALLATLGLLG